MQIVIDIDEDTYRYMQSRFKYQNKGDKGLSKFEKAGIAIKTGTPLPKGHGRLIDADALYADLTFPTQQFAKAFHEILDDAPTMIIPAEKDGESNG